MALAAGQGPCDVPRDAGHRKFDVVDVAPAQFDVPLPVYVPQGKGPLVRQTFENTARMLETFERRFGEPYRGTSTPTSSSGTAGGMDERYQPLRHRCARRDR